MTVVEQFTSSALEGGRRDLKCSKGSQDPTKDDRHPRVARGSSSVHKVNIVLLKLPGAD